MQNLDSLTSRQKETYLAITDIMEKNPGMSLRLAGKKTKTNVDTYKSALVRLGLEPETRTRKLAQSGGMQTILLQESPPQHKKVMVMITDRDEAIAIVKQFLGE